MRQHEIEVSTAIGCVNRCSYCPQQLAIDSYRMRSDETSMTLNAFSNYLSKIPKHVILRFAGFTEPFQNQNTLDMIELAFGQGFRIAVFTTLKGLDAKKILRLRMHRYYIFLVHLQGKGERYLPYDKYIPLVKLIRDIPEASFTYYDSLDPEIAQAVQGATVTKLRVNTRAGVIQEYGHTTGPIVCSWDYPRKRNILLPNGDVVMCCMDYGQKIVLGNLKNDSYRHLHHGQSWRRLARLMSEEDNDLLCRDCEYAVNRFSTKYPVTVTKGLVWSPKLNRLYESWREKQ
jgi:radical SAM protein with 4Fe4S-binding SPASM domain